MQPITINTYMQPITINTYMQPIIIKTHIQPIVINTYSMIYFLYFILLFAYNICLEHFDEHCSKLNALINLK